MKATEAQELQKTFTDMNRYRAQFILQDIYVAINQSALTRVSYTEKFIPWNKNSESDDRKAIIRAILLELKNKGYRVIIEGEKAKYTRLRIWW